MLIREIDRLAHIAVNDNWTVRKDNLLVQLKHLNRLYSEAELSETATNEVQRLRENFAELLRNEQKNYNLIIAYKRTTTFSSGVIMAISLSFAITALYYSYRYYNQQKAIIEKSNSTTTDVQRVQAVLTPIFKQRHY